MCVFAESQGSSTLAFAVIVPLSCIQMSFPAHSQPMVVQATSQGLPVSTGIQPSAGGMSAAGGMNPMAPHGGATMQQNPGMQATVQQQQQQAQQQQQGRPNVSTWLH